MRTQLFKSCKLTPYELILSESISPHIRYIRKYGVYTVHGNPMYGFGQPCICTVYRVVQFEVRPKIRVRGLSRILTNLQSSVQSSVKV
jgi:hypothetical protein